MMRISARNSRRLPGAVTHWIVCAALGAGSNVATVRAEGDAAVTAATVTVTVAEPAAEKDTKDDLPPKPVFAPEVEKRLADLMVKMTEIRRKTWVAKMGKVIDRIGKITGLDEQGRKALDVPSREAVEACLPAWKEASDRMLRTSVKQSPEQVLVALESMVNTAAGLSMMPEGSENATTPDEHSAWTEALKKNLTPEQLAAWEKSLAQEKEKLKAEIGDRVNAWLEPTREPMQESIFSKAAEISRSLNLPKERADQLKALGKNAVEQSIGKMRAREEKMLAGMEEEPRRQLLKNARMYFSPNPNEQPEHLPVWKTGLATLLSAEERKQLDANASEHQARRIPALAHLMLAEFDRKVALTPTQRERLEPICDKMAAASVGTLLDESDRSYQINLFDTLVNGLKPMETDVRAILEPIQWQHWLEASALTGEDRRNRLARPAPAREKEEKVTAPPEPEEYERAISDYLEAKTEKMRRRALAEFLLRAEDAGRAANLPAEKVEQLKTAARGAVEDSLRQWKTNADLSVRSFVMDASARVVRRRLETMQEYSFQRKLNPSPETLPLWVNAFKANLDSGQIAASEKSAQQREAFQSEAIAGFIVAIFDKSQPITPEQYAKLAPAVAAAVKEYQPDLLRYFSGFNNTEWYLSSYSMFLPVAAVPEAELKSILGAERFDLWQHSQQFSNAMNYWPGLKQNHDARLNSSKK